MANKKYRTFYRKLIAMYPRAFRERFGESMLQTFDDLCSEQTETPSGFMLWIFIDAVTGIAREHAMRIAQRSKMSDTLTDPKKAAIISLILCLPFAVSYAIPVFEIEPLLGLFKSLVTTDGQQINSLGRFIIFGGILLLPAAFLLNLSSMFTKRPMSFRPRALNLALGLSVASMIFLIGGWMVAEAINCSRGICD